MRCVTVQGRSKIVLDLFQIAQDSEPPDCDNLLPCSCIPRIPESEVFFSEIRLCLTVPTVNTVEPGSERSS